MRSGRRLSSKQDANLFIMPIARSVAPNSNAPASEVTGPASNAATTLRPSTDANSKRSALHSVGIGALRESEINCCGTTIFADSQPRCTLFGERSALAGLQVFPNSWTVRETSLSIEEWTRLRPIRHSALRFYGILGSPGI